MSARKKPQITAPIVARRKILGEEKLPLSGKYLRACY